MAKEKHKRQASSAKRTKSRDRERDRATKDAPARPVPSFPPQTRTCFSSSSLIVMPQLHSCKNSLGFLFEFYDLNRTLRDILPLHPPARPRRLPCRGRAIESAVDFMLYFYGPTCGGGSCSSGIFPAMVVGARDGYVLYLPTPSSPRPSKHPGTLLEPYLACRKPSRSRSVPIRADETRASRQE